MSARKTRRGIRTKAMPETPQAQVGADVNVGEHQTGVLLCPEKAGSAADAVPARNSSPEEFLPGDVHNVHNVHTPVDSDILSDATDPTEEEVAAAIGVIEAAIAECADNPGVLGSDAFSKAARLVRRRDPSEWMRLRVAIKQAKPSGVLLEEIDKASRPEGEGGDETTTADELVALVRERADLWHAEDGACYATLTEAPRQTLRLDSKAFVEWLGYAYYTATANEKKPGRAASDAAMKTARMVLIGIATNEGQEHPAYLRAAKHWDTYYIDIGSDDWTAIEVNARGWRVIDNPPVRFWRASTTRPLPTPAPSGDLARLWKYANIPEPDRLLVLALLLDAWRPETPFPILELVGQQGSAKSSTQSRLRDCIDPNAINLRAAPKSTEDLFVSAGANWCCSLNNLSRLSAGIQDALCNLATGGGFAGRTLYTNADETVFEAKRPVMLNGIVPLVTAQDLTDRVIHIELPVLDAYVSETDLDASFQKDAPAILTGLLELFVDSLAALPAVTIPRPPRMADFAHLGEAMCRALGKPEGAFVAMYQANRRESVARNLEASPVAMAIRAMADARPDSKLIFSGTMKRLLDAVNNHREPSVDAWPKSPRGLGDALRRQLPALAQIGLNVEITAPGREGVTVNIRRVEVAREHCELCERGSETIPPWDSFSQAQHSDVEAF